MSVILSSAALALWIRSRIDYDQVQWHALHVGGWIVSSRGTLGAWWYRDKDSLNQWILDSTPQHDPGAEAGHTFHFSDLSSWEDIRIGAVSAGWRRGRYSLTLPIPLAAVLLGIPAALFAITRIGVRIQARRRLTRDLCQ